MPKLKRPTIGLARSANPHSAPNETIAEFSSSRGIGGLISVRELEDGSVVVSVYRCDPEVLVLAPPKPKKARRSAAATTKENP